MNFSDYIVYVDESGDHSLTSVDPNYPVFVLAFCVVRKQDYMDVVVPQAQAFKFRWFGRDTVVLHESDIRKDRPPFHFLKSRETKARFLDEFTGIMRDAPMTIIASVIRKGALTSRYADPENPYHLSLMFCLERLQTFLDKQGQTGRISHVVFEKRGKREDAELTEAFARLQSGTHYLARRSFPDIRIDLAGKQVNSTGLQIADLVARPIGLHALHPDHQNRAFDIVRSKIPPDGLKIFP